MFRPIGMLAAAGIVGVVLTRLLWAMLLPLFGAALGFLFFILKIVLIVGLIGAGWWCFARWTDKPSEA